MLQHLHPGDPIRLPAGLKRWLYVGTHALGIGLGALYLISIAQEGNTLGFLVAAGFTGAMCAFLLAFLIAPRWLDAVEYAHYLTMVVAILVLGSGQVAALAVERALTPDKLGFIVNTSVMLLAIYLLGAFLALPLARMLRVLQVTWAAAGLLAAAAALALRPPAELTLSYVIGVVAGLTLLGVYSLLLLGLGFTRRRRTEESLLHSRRFLERVLAASPSVVRIVELASGREVYASAPLAGLLGHAAGWEETSEAALAGHLHPDDRAAQLDRAALLALADEQVLERELRVRHADGGWRWLSSSSVVFSRGAGGEPAQVLSQVFDVTARKRAEEAVQEQAEALSRANAELTRALRHRDEFMAMMSHELRTPLNAVLGTAEALTDEVYGPLTEKQRRALGRLTQGGQHLLGMLSDILDMTQIEAGAARLDLELIPAGELCQAALQLVADRARAKGLRLTSDAAAGVRSLRGDRRRLTQILANLLENAVKFTPAGGEVALEVAGDPAREQLALTVRDTGIGIAGEDMQRMFQPFVQADARLARAYEGVGLGLALVQRLVDLHGGGVQVSSEPGVGSRFTVTLPWRAEDNEGAPAPAPLALDRPGWRRPPLVLLAEDHEPTLELYADTLAPLGCELALARSGAEALAQIRARRPDVVLLDIQMPELDGLEVLRRVRADSDLAATPIAAVTALAMPGDRERVLQAGADRFLPKPVGGAALAAVVAALYREPAAG